MKSFWALLGILAVAASIALASDSVAEYPAHEARKHIGEIVTIVGQVDGIKKFDDGMTLLNLDGRYPNQALTVVVRPANTAAVGDLSEFVGKTVRVTGKIIEYRGGPEIEIRTKDAIAVRK